jgi:Holliday junction DNA helicase RuvA
MIGRIAGRIDYRADDHVLIDVKGVGYLVYVSDRTMSALPGNGEAVALYTDLLVREDNLQLFGFTSLVEKEWHRLLMSVQGVGAKASMAILGTLGADGVSRAIALGDWNAVKAAKGIGPKTAQRVVNELKDKAASVMALAGAGGSAGAGSGAAAPEPDLDDVVIETPAVAGAGAVPPTPSSDPAAQAEALSALTNLGYAPGEAASAVAQALGDDPGLNTAGLIRAALKLLAPKG